MYIYADESGNTGQAIFNDPEWFYQGAILSLDDINPIVQPIVTRHVQRLGVDRIHANEIPVYEVAKIAEEIIIVLQSEARFRFHLTRIQKPYLATTKFVDTIFDSEENIGARWLWYNGQFFRHTLCILMNSALTPLNKIKFWNALLSADIDEIKESIRNAKTYLGRYTADRRLLTVVLDAFQYAVRHADELYLTNSSKEARLLHGPNMIAFSSLINCVHDYAELHSSPPIAFVHDQSEQFNKSMTAMHEIRKNAQFKALDIGGETKIVEWDLGALSLPSSKDSVELQAVDVLLWVLQRRKQEELSIVQRQLEGHIDLHEISVEMSQKIHSMWLNKVNSAKIPLSQLDDGKRMIEEMERRYYEGVYR